MSIRFLVSFTGCMQKWHPGLFSRGIEGHKRNACMACMRKILANSPGPPRWTSAGLSAPASHVRGRRRALPHSRRWPQIRRWRVRGGPVRAAAESATAGPGRPGHPDRDIAAALSTICAARPRACPLVLIPPCATTMVDLTRRLKRARRCLAHLRRNYRGGDVRITATHGVVDLARRVPDIAVRCAVHAAPQDPSHLRWAKHLAAMCHAGYAKRRARRSGAVSGYRHHVRRHYARPLRGAGHALGGAQLGPQACRTSRARGRGSHSTSVQVIQRWRVRGRASRSRT